MPFCNYPVSVSMIIAGSPAKSENVAWGNGSGSIGLWITQQFIRTAGWCSFSAMGRRLAQGFKAGSGRSIRFAPDAFGCFFVCGNRVYCVWKFMKN